MSRENVQVPFFPICHQGSRALTLNTWDFKFLCTVDFLVRLPNVSWVSANFMAHVVSRICSFRHGWVVLFFTLKKTLSPILSMIWLFPKTLQCPLGKLQLSFWFVYVTHQSVSSVVHLLCHRFRSNFTIFVPNLMYSCYHCTRTISSKVMRYHAETVRIFYKHPKIALNYQKFVLKVNIITSFASHDFDKWIQKYFITRMCTRI